LSLFPFTLNTVRNTIDGDRIFARGVPYLKSERCANARDGGVIKIDRLRETTNSTWEMLVAVETGRPGDLQINTFRMRGRETSRARNEAEIFAEMWRRFFISWRDFSFAVRVPSPVNFMRYSTVPVVLLRNQNRELR